MSDSNKDNSDIEQTRHNLQTKYKLLKRKFNQLLLVAF